jgi:sterol desaturase/sphingolipid hydroxylase (fatty acid hydroxylase superfamily)
MLLYSTSAGVQLVLVLGLYVVLGIFEIQFPAERAQSLAGRGRNFLYTIFLLVTGALASVFIYFLIPLHPRYLPDNGILFSICIVFAYIFLVDFIFYWYHRAEHRFSFLWTIHELHHSDTELNATTGMRTYWLERPIQTVLMSVPIGYIIGIDPTATVILPILMTSWLFFSHANWKLRMGFLTPVFCGPQLHRIHHSNLSQHQNKNMAQFFPIIDIIFGTYYAPAYDEFPTTGTPTLASNAPVGQVLVRPFKTWGAYIKKIFK